MNQLKEIKVHSNNTRNDVELAKQKTKQAIIHMEVVKDQHCNALVSEFVETIAEAKDLTKQELNLYAEELIRNVKDLYTKRF